MIVLQTIAVAFAMFSAIPVPQFDWNEKNMRYAMCAFPLIGVVIGAAWCACGAMPLPGLAKAAGSAKAVNLVLLGRLSRYFDFTEDEWMAAIEKSVPEKFLELNKKAFRMGQSA